MYIFSYCPFLALQNLSLPVIVLPLLLGTLSHAEHHTALLLAPTHRVCCPRSQDLLQ